jgi:glycogen operon protein
MTGCVPAMSRTPLVHDIAPAAAPRLFPGQPLPLGVSETHRGLNFAVFSRHATAVWLVVFAADTERIASEIALDPINHRTGDIWHAELEGVADGVAYGWRADGPHDPWHRFDPNRILTDPYAHALDGASQWRSSPAGNGVQRRSLHLSSSFDWQGVQPPRIHLADKVIYELHVRGFTQHVSSGVTHPGTFGGLIEKVSYLQALGITTVELLPVYEFDENEGDRIDPQTGKRLGNYWGYNPISFFATKAAYASEARNGNQVRELKTLVRELHRAGIEVFLDVVFNHTAEGAGTADSPTFSLRGLDNAIYYMLDPITGAYRDYSGCGNTLNCNHPVVRDLIRDALRYWVSELHIDGFRFDLASILTRGRDGGVLPLAPLIERIAEDPVLADVTLIAEPWDATGLYQVGSFSQWGCWAEWNGPFRDDVRRFVRGEPGRTGVLATRLAGSSDLFQPSGGRPYHSINFVTSHDGFTLADLVAYDRKHNHANGEDNRDGLAENFSWNCGVEGDTDDAAIIALRKRQTRNFLALLLLSRGTPMLLAGDEMGRTQRGNNNAYCQDNDVSWLDWSLLERNPDLFRFTQKLIALRRAHPVLRGREFLTGLGTASDPTPDVIWHGLEPQQPDWGPTSSFLAMQLSGAHCTPRDCDFYLAVSNAIEPQRVTLPPAPGGRCWRWVIDTGRAAPDDFVDETRSLPITEASILLRSFSCVLLRNP